MRAAGGLAALGMMLAPCALRAQPVLVPAAPSVAKPPVAPKMLPPVMLPLAPITINYVYTAIPQAGAPHRLGRVIAGVDWVCGQKACEATTAWDQPAVGGCAALARQIGPIADYGRKGASLSPADLDLCNRGIAGAVMLTKAAPPPTPTPSEPAPAPTTPAASEPAAPVAVAATPPRIMAVAVSELAFVGGAQGTIDRTAGVLTIASGELSITGGASGPRPMTPPPMTINVPEMSIIGR